MKKKILFILTIIGALLFAGTVLGLGGYFYKINPGANEVSHDTFTRGLVGYWDFDEGAGTTAQDYSGNNNHGTLENGPAWTEGQSSGGGLSFDGTDDYVAFSTISDITNNENYSVSLWVSPDDLTTTQAVYGHSLSASNRSAISIGSNAIRCGHYNGSTYSQISGTISSGWSHIVFIHESGGTNHLYIDGVSQAGSGAPSAGSTVGFRIGSTSAGSCFFNGQIDQVRIYNRALSAEEVRYHYNRGGPVASWDFDEGSGSIAYDSTGNGNDGVLKNMDDSDWVEGKDGTALDFNGSNDYVDCGNDSSINSLISNFTVSAWIKSDNVGGGVRRVAASARQTNNGFAFGTNNTGLRFTSFGRQDYNSTSITISTGNWYHIVAVFDDSYDVLFYVDGIYKETVAGALAVASNMDNFYIGTTTLNGSSTLAEIFNGQIDQVRIYDYARTADEILLDYNKGKAAHFGLSTTDCAADPASCMDYGLVGNWGMDEGAGTTAQDYSGNNNHGTLENGPVWTEGQSSGGGLSFDGADDYVDISTAVIDNYPYTFEAWVKRSRSDNGVDCAMSVANDGDLSKYIAIGLNDVPTERFYFYDIRTTGNSRGAENWASVTGGGTPDNNWHHLVGVSTSSTNHILYLDGVELASSNTSVTYSGMAFDSTTIGCTGDATPIYFKGQIDQVRIYNRALSAEEIQYHYNRGGPVASWDFDQGSGSIAYDSTGNGNDGVLNHGSSGDNDSYSDMWVSGKDKTGIDFDGSNDYVNCGNIGTAKTLAFWMNPDTITESILEELDNVGVSISSGTMTYPSWDNCFVDGIDTDTITTGWHHIVLTSTTNVTTSAFRIGLLDTTYFDGILDDVKIYQYERSAPEILLDYNKGKAAHFGLSTTDCDKNPASCMDYGLVGNWGMDEGAGTTAQDYSGNNNHGTLENGPVWTEGQSSGGGLSFDGTDDYVDCGNDGSIRFSSNNFSIAAWVKMPTSTAHRTIAGVGRHNVDEWFFYYNHSSPIYSYSFYGGNGNINLSATTDPRDNVWHHVVFVRNGSNGYIYFNGIEENSQSGITCNLSSSKALLIGKNETLGEYFNGQIDQVRSYNRALSAEEVRYHYNRGGPVAEWKMNERTGAKIYDSTGNNNDGKLNFGAAGTNTSYEDMWQGASDNLGIEFDGTDDYVNCGNDASLDITDAITIEAWINTNTLDYDGIVAKKSAAEWGINVGYSLNLRNDGSFLFKVGNKETLTSSIINIGEWNHIVGRYINNTPSEIYINGVEANYTGQQTPLNLGASTDNCYIGKYYSDREFNGQIDQVRIYNRALGASEILQRYWEGKMKHP